MFRKNIPQIAQLEALKFAFTPSSLRHVVLQELNISFLKHSNSHAVLQAFNLSKVEKLKVSDFHKFF